MSKTIKFKSIFEVAEDLLIHLRTLNKHQNFTVSIVAHVIAVDSDLDLSCPSIYDGYPVIKTITGRNA